jgi:hypothetical protein
MAPFVLLAIALAALSQPFAAGGLALVALSVFISREA